MTDFIRETCMLQLLPDDQIRQGIRERLQKKEQPPENMLLTWRREGEEYLLEIMLAEEAAVQMQKITVGRVRVDEYDALNRLGMAGRLYFRLHKEFPTLRRKMSRYQYQPFR